MEYASTVLLLGIGLLITMIVFGLLTKLFFEVKPGQKTNLIAKKKSRSTYTIVVFLTALAFLAMLYLWLELAIELVAASIFSQGLVFVGILVAFTMYFFDAIYVHRSPIVNSKIREKADRIYIDSVNNAILMSVLSSIVTVIAYFE